MLLQNEIHNKNIIISALNWGFGHISRTCAIIQQLKNNNHIIICSEKSQSDFYYHLFPDIPQISIPESAINFYPQQNILKNIFKYTHLFFKSIKNEHTTLKQILNIHKIKPDIIISDNRYGFYHPEYKSIFITHQLNLPLPFYLSIANTLHHLLMKNFDEIWIPDFENETNSLAGKLSHSNNFSSKIKYIGPQSLMTKQNVEKTIDYLFIISGTNAERHYFEDIIKQQVKYLLNQNKNQVIKVIGGFHNDNNIYLGWKNISETNNLILQSKNIITRAGYSTLMDLYQIKEPAQQIYFLPSSRQYEQMYLYNYWISKGWAKKWEVVD